MKDSKWIKTEQMLIELKANSGREHQYCHWIVGTLISTHWLVYDSDKKSYGDSTGSLHYDWYSESEFLSIYAEHWWKRES